jgi:hypothetical protein
LSWHASECLTPGEEDILQLQTKKPLDTTSGTYGTEMYPPPKHETSDNIIVQRTNTKFKQAASAAG